LLPVSDHAILPLVPDLPSPSVFLDMPIERRLAENTPAFAIRDNYPVSPGHTLVIPKRLIATWFDATHDEQLAIMALVAQTKTALDAEFKPDGYNVGFNSGTAAGQTVMHLHVHVIPRFAGDMPDPRGGVRHVIPGKGNYLNATSTDTVPEDSVFAENLLSLLDGGRFTTTYKYAVLLGLMDLCLEKSTAAGDAPTSVTTKELAEKVLALYWPQSRTFTIGNTVLRQNSDPTKPASILARLIEFREHHARDASASIGRARIDAPEPFQKLLRAIEWTLVEMPLPRLQRRGDTPSDTDPFLYRIEWSLSDPVTPRQFNTGANPSPRPAGGGRRMD
jgi:diadenosine tetraphosphate (Ap4A) HIT family hydrolase